MPDQQQGLQGVYDSKEKEKDVRRSNILAAKSIASAVRTSLGPRGMDKMITSETGEVTITNDGATILSKMHVRHPAAQMFVELSKSQDVEAGDGTTSVVVLAGALASAAEHLLDRNIHPATISHAFLKAERKAQEILKTISEPVNVLNEESLLAAASTSLNSKVVNQYSQTLAPMAVQAVLSVIDPATADNVDLNDVRVVQQIGGTVEDTELIKGLVFSHRTSQAPGAPHSVADAKIALLQFCLSAPKTNIENNVIVSDYTQMDRLLKEERNYILKLCKAIKKSGANVVLLQKSILRDATSDLALHFLAKMKIMVVSDIERSDIELICKNIGCQPIASVEGLAPAKLGHAALVDEESTPSGKIVRITGVKGAEGSSSNGSVCVLVRGSNPLVLAEAERSLHDALCVVRSLVKCRMLTPGGGAPEVELSLRLAEWSRTLKGIDAYCARAFADALELIPYTLAENAGMNPINIVTELRARHAAGKKRSGLDIKNSCVCDDIMELGVVQPLLVNSSALNLATETISLLLKIDDLLYSRI